VDLQTTVFVGFASLVAAGLAVSAGGWILFVRERRAHDAGRSPDASNRDSPGDAGARGVHHHGDDGFGAER
jgi:hypothetical protein